MRADQSQPGVFVDGLDAQFRGLFRLRSRPGAGDQQIGLGADGASDLGAQGFGPGLGLGTGHLFQRAGEDHGLARDRRCRSRRRRRVRRSDGTTSASMAARSAGLAKASVRLVRQRSADAVDGGQFFPVGIAGVGFGHGCFKGVPGAVVAGKQAWQRLRPRGGCQGQRSGGPAGCFASPRSRRTVWSTEVSPKPSRFFSFFRGLAASLAARVKMSAGVFTGRSGSWKNISTCLAPRPSMSKALRETKCFSRSTALGGADQAAGAAADGIALFALGGAAAFRAGVRENVRVRCPQGGGSGRHPRSWG